MNNRLSRRQFLKLITAGVTGLWLDAFIPEVPTAEEASSQDSYQNIPLVFNQPSYPADFGSKVVHTYSPTITSWNGSASQYWRYVNQEAADRMVDLGLQTLTEKSSVAQAWRAILPNYRSSEKIAIKVSFNNCRDCNDTDGQIDAVVEPLNSVIRGLKQMGVAESDIWIFDASRVIPNRFKNGCLYNGVEFYDQVNRGCGLNAGFSSDSPTAQIALNPPPGFPPTPVIRLTDVMIAAAYVINIPIMKHHGAGVSLAFKNHFGSIDHPEDLHDFIGPSATEDYSALVDLYMNPHIREKTVLTIGDGIFAAKMNYDPPTLWTSFNNQVPKSLFFSTDPVAIDCVMCDYLDAEKTIASYSDGYLRLASQAGLGVYERGDPWGNGYNLIEYVKLDP